MTGNNVSVIVTTRNRKYEVRRALDSVYAQTVQPAEIILVDDGSEDGTEAYIKSQGYNDLLYIRNPENDKHSTGHSRNLGIHHAKSEYIAFLDSDSVWYPNKLEVFISRIQKAEAGIDIAYSHYKKYIKLHAIELPRKLSPNYDDKKEEALLHNPVNAGAAVYRREYLQEIGLFNEEMVTNTDWELLLRGIHLQDTKIMEIEEVLSENWTMYDGVTEDRQREVKERLQVVTKYMDEIKKMDNIENFYRAYVAHPGTEMSRPELNTALINACKDDPDWIIKLMELQCADMEALEKQAGRKSSFYQLMYNWLQLKLGNDSIEKRLLTMGCKSVAIYGAGKHGKLLYQELEQSRITVACFIDNQKKEIAGGIPVYTLQEALPEVDAIIITPYLEISSIRAELKARTDRKLILLNTLVSPNENQWQSYM